MQPRLLTLRSLGLSVALHLLAAALLVFSFDFSSRNLFKPAPVVNIVQTVAIDEKQVQQEVERLQKIDRDKAEAARKKEQELQRKLADLQRQAKATEKKRVEEEKRLAEVAQKKEQEARQRQAEQEKLAELKKQADALEQKKRAEEARRKKEAEAKKRAEEERKQKEAEAVLKNMLAEEQKAREAAQAKADMNIIAQYSARIQAAIQQRYNITGLDTGLSAQLLIRMVPGGEVVSVQIEKSSGNEVFDRRAEAAVYEASPLPVPAETRLFEQLREIRFTFCPTCTR